MKVDAATSVPEPKVFSYASAAAKTIVGAAAPETSAAALGNGAPMNTPAVNGLPREKRERGKRNPRGDGKGENGKPAEESKDLDDGSKGQRKPPQNSTNANVSTPSNAKSDPKFGAALFVGRIPEGTKEDDIKGAFSVYGQVEKVYMPPGKNHGKIYFAHPDSVEKALKNDKVELQGTILKLDRLKETQKKGTDGHSSQGKKGNLIAQSQPHKQNGNSNGNNGNVSVGSSGQQRPQSAQGTGRPRGPGAGKDKQQAAGATK